MFCEISKYVIFFELQQTVMYMASIYKYDYFCMLTLPSAILNMLLVQGHFLEVPWDFLQKQPYCLRTDG